MRNQWLCVFIVAVAGASTSLAADGNLSDDFYNAIRANDLARLQALVGGGADVNSRDSRGETPLMYAAAVGSVEAMKFLVGKGAEVNAQTELGSTALIWSSTDLAKVRCLLDHGANVNMATKRGRTALFVAAMSDHSAEIVRLLVAKGADVKATDSFKNTTLSAAAVGNDTDTIGMMIEAGVDVNAAGVTGLTPLMVTAGFYGNLRATRMLLAKGAKVNVAAKAPFLFFPDPPKAGPPALSSLTPLMATAPYGPAALIKMLLDSGADVNAKDMRGMTPLMLAVATDRQDPAVIRMLLDHGADPNLKSNLGETALDWARKVGPRAGIEILKAKGVTSSEPAPAVPASAQAPLELRPAVERSVALMEKSSWEFFLGSGCVSCHSQNMTDLAVAEARAKGVRVDSKAAEERIRMVKASFPVEPLYERMDIHVPEITAYSLAGLAASGYPADRMTDAMAANIAAAQKANGSWRLGMVARPGAEDGDISRTALCIRSLKAYGPPGRAAEMGARVAKARQWLLAAGPITAEDRTMQLLGLYWAGAGTTVRARFAKAILAGQQPDGGWRQRDGLASDAYATGESLYALAAAGGVAPTEAAYRKGVKFLLTTQHNDGSWHVASRAPKFQLYFESGFPHGGDQWISTWATGWAAMALARAMEAPAKAAPPTRAGLD